MPQSSEAPAEALPLLFYADAYRFPDVYHLTRFLAPDPIIALEQGSDIVIVATSLEESRARKESRATTVVNMDAYGAKELSAAGTPPDELVATVIKRLLDERRLTRVMVPPYFYIAIADRLRGKGVKIVVADDVRERRRAKRPDEIAALETVQRATEEAWAAGVGALRRAGVRHDRTLELDGAVFTAERLRAIVEAALLERGCHAPEGTITAPGAQGADPHATGSGPLRAGEAIVMDIFPQHVANRYYADMTRTVSKGEPAAEIVRMYEVVRRAQDLGIAALRPGITGRAVHELVEDVIWEAGYDTLRPGQARHTDGVPRGFIHGTGHGVGLEIHEAPYLGRGGVKPLAAGDVVTVEPGVYDPAIGGVRLEDMLLITADGARNLTRAPRELAI